MTNVNSSFASGSMVTGTFGVAAASNYLATQTAMGVLERGGNAFDACVAAGFVFQVVEPHMCGLGGELVALIHRAHDTEPVVLCGQGVAPAAATIDRMNEIGCDLVPTSGLLPAVVPGAFDAWMLLLRDFGTMSLSDVLTPAANYAKNGFPVSADLCRALSKAANNFKTKWPSSASCHLAFNSIPTAGDLHCNVDLAETYRSIIAAGESHSNDRIEQIEAARRFFYRGPIAERIGDFVDYTGDLDKPIEQVGLITSQDLADWNATFEKPVSINWHGHQIFKPGFWSQGPVLLQILQILADDPLGEFDPVGAEITHLITEAAKLAFADREAWYGDSGTDEVDERSALLDLDYGLSRRKLINDRVVKSYPHGNPQQTQPNTYVPTDVPHRKTSSNVYVPEDGDTSHIDIVDQWGNVVSATPSGGWLQGSPTIDGLGFCLSTRAQMFWLDKNSPSRLAPGKRPRTTLSPTLALSDQTVLGFGSKGADFADQWTAQFAVRFFCQKHDLQSAMDAPMFGSMHWKDSVYPRKEDPNILHVDPRYTREVLETLGEYGHRVKVADINRHGRNCAVAANQKLLSGAASLKMPNASAVGR